MVGVRRAVVAFLAVGLVAAGIVGWWLFTSAAQDGAAAETGACAETAAAQTSPPEVGMLVCRYDTEGSLTGTGRLPAGDAVWAERALAEGPEGDPGCTAESASPPTARLVSADHDAVLTLDRACSTYVLDGQPPRRMTPEVRAWAQVESGR